MNAVTETVAAEPVSGVELFVPLARLKKSPKNARKVPHGEAAIEALAASIQHKGLIQNLVVEPETKEDGTPTGNYLVTAGEGRRLAMLLRAKRKQIKKSEVVRCWLDTANDPSEISLDENVTRTPMHPADQFERFRELSESKGYGAEEIGARFDDPAERAWAAEWLAAILASEGVAVDPQAKEHLWSALGSLASAPVPERTLTGLAVLLQSQQLKQALASYCIGGPWGRLLDAEAERLGEASVQAFETEGLVGAGSAAAVLSYLFHRIEGRLDGSPTLIIIDEGWLVLDSPDFAAQLREWLKTLRKKNASVVFATQSLADIETSNIAPAIIESCPTRIFLPNERAAEPQIAAIYERFGLNARQIEILSRAAPKRDYYCQSRRGNRLFELGLGEIALAFAAASSKTDQLRIAELVETHGRERFAAEWLRHRGLAWAVDLLPEPQPDSLAGRREDAGQLPLALKDMTP